MNDAREVAAALASQVEAVCRTLLPGGQRQGCWYVTGSTQGDRGKSLAVCLTGRHPGQWRDYATDQHGDLLSLIRAVYGFSFPAAMAWALTWLGQPPAPVRDAPVIDQPADRTEAARRIWDECVPADRTPVETYLASRGVGLASDLRFHQDLWHPRARKAFPAMVAAVRDRDGNLVAIHRTYLTHDGRKASVDPPRMALGPLSKTAIRLAPAGTTLGVAEGIETALSASRLFGLPVWSCLSAPVLQGFVPPDDWCEVVIFADRDPAGLKAAKLCASRLNGQGIACSIRAPRQGDYNDVLRSKACVS